MNRRRIIFAHGAGAPSASAWMVAWRRRLEGLGHVEAFDYPYMSAKKKRPDPHEKLVAAHAEVVRRAPTDGPLVLAGKSMGSRIGCHVAVEHPELSERIGALVCFGYPLKGQSGKLREAVLIELRTPILFIQGTRDALCPLDLLAETRTRMTARSELHVVDGGDHSLIVTKGALAKRNETQADVDSRIFDAIEAFLTVAGV